MDIQKVIDWCDAQVAQEKEVVLKRESGGNPASRVANG